MTGGSLGNVPWDRRETGGSTYFIKTGGAMTTMTPVLALNDNMLLFGLSVDAVKSALERLGATGGKLDESPAFQKASASVAKPHNSFGYVDGAVLFDRVYTLVRPFLMMAPMMAPKLAQHVPVDKLPGTGTISKHLGPIVYSQSETPDGILIESAGPVTMNQAVFGTAVAVGAAVVPLAKSGMAGMMAPGLFPQRQNTPPAATPSPAASPAEVPETPGIPAPADGTGSDGASTNP
jgi:hypothetical protein